LKPVSVYSNGLPLEILTQGVSKIVLISLRTGLIATKGFEDSHRMGRGCRPLCHSICQIWRGKSFYAVKQRTINPAFFDIVLFAMFYHFPKDKQTGPCPVKRDQGYIE